MSQQPLLLSDCESLLLILFFTFENSDHYNPPGSVFANMFLFFWTVYFQVFLPGRHYRFWDHIHLGAFRTIQFHIHLVRCRSFDCISGSNNHQTDHQRLLDLEGKKDHDSQGLHKKESLTNVLVSLCFCLEGSLSELWNGEYLLLWNNSVNLQRWQNQHCKMHKVR